MPPSDAVAPDTGTPPEHDAAFTLLQLVPSLNEGGVERGAIEIAHAVVAEGGRALVASEGGRLEPSLRRAGGELIRLPLAERSPISIFRNIGRISRILADENVSILHARSRAPAWSGLFAARKAGVPFVTTYHGTYSENFPLKRMYNSVMARGQPVIAISEFIADLVAERHHVPRARIVTIPRGADIAHFDEELVSAQRTITLAQDWGITDDPRPVVLFPARLTRWKGQAVMLEAASALVDGDGRLPCRLIMAGGDADSAYGEELLRQSKSRGLDRDLSLVGHVSDMPAALKLAAVVVCPSLEPEAFGRTVVEAQAMGRPVIASDHGGARETVDNGGSGWLVAPGDVEALADALQSALAMDESARAHMGLAGRARVRARYAVSRMQAETLKVYQDVLNGDYA